MRYVENEGALFRIAGPSNAFPNEVCSPKEKKFVPYEGDVPKPVSWGQFGAGPGVAALRHG